MFINGIYSNGLPQLLVRGQDYKNVDILITSGNTKSVVESITGDYNQMGSSGYIVWGSSHWPKRIISIGYEERLNYYKDLDISEVGKELLFFRNFSVEGEKDLVVVHSLEEKMSAQNIHYVLKNCLKVEVLNDCQLLLILSMSSHNNQRVSSYMNSNVGLLLI